MSNMPSMPVSAPDEVTVCVGYNKTIIVISGVTTPTQLAECFTKLHEAAIGAIGVLIAPDAHLEAAYEDAQSGNSDAIDFDHGFNDY